jgi:hypothetical protein
MSARTGRGASDSIPGKVAQLVRQRSDESLPVSVSGEPLAPSGATAVLMHFAEPRQKPVTNGDEHVAAGFAYRRAVDLDPRQAQLEGFGVTDLVGDDDLDRGDRQVGGTEQGNVDDVAGAEPPFLYGSEHLSRHLLLGHGFAVALSTASTKRDRSTPASPVLDGLDDQSLGGEMDNSLGVARRLPMVVVTSFHVSGVEIDDGVATGAGVSPAAERLLG